MITVTVMTVLFLIFMGAVAAHGEPYHITIRGGLHFHDYCHLCMLGVMTCSDCVLDTNSTLGIGDLNCIVAEHLSKPCIETEKISFDQQLCVFRPNTPICNGQDLPGGHYPYLDYLLRHKLPFPHNPGESSEWVSVIRI